MFGSNRRRIKRWDKNLKRNEALTIKYRDLQHKCICIGLPDEANKCTEALLELENMSEEATCVLQLLRRKELT